MSIEDEGQGRIAAITGITGFIGGHLAAHLAARGWRVRALARSMPRAPTGAPVELIPGGLGEIEALQALVGGAEVVIHLAGAIKGRTRDDFMRANADGTGALAAAWRAHAPRARFLLVSSMAARAPELSHYAASKRAAEERLAEGGGDWSILRPAAVYGAGDRETLRIFRAASGRLQPMLNGPGARLTLVHVDDLARAASAMLEGAGSGAVHEVTDARHGGYSWEELARAAAAALGRAARPVRVPRPAVRLLGGLGDLTAALGGGAGMMTSQKAREILHPDWSSDPARQVPPALWRPEVGLEQGFARAVAWYRAAGWLGN
jgi:nucleoside-diphosphate-sugar epimerase